MERFRKYLLVTLGFALAGAIGAAFGTGTAQAVVASLVQIANTTSSPAPTLNVTDPGRIAYQRQLVNAGCNGGNLCSFYFPAVPTGHRVVIQQISAYFFLSAAPSDVEFSIITQGSGELAHSFAPIRPGLSAVAFVMPVLLYVDASDSALVKLDVAGATFVIYNSSVTLTGYELDCTIASCAAIATQ